MIATRVQFAITDLSFAENQRDRRWRRRRPRFDLRDNAITEFRGPLGATAPAEHFLLLVGIEAVERTRGRDASATILASSRDSESLQISDLTVIKAVAVVAKAEIDAVQTWRTPPPSAHNS